jgi:folate-dependent phosphoribosylglycinamide formyltransferase PurN
LEKERKDIFQAATAIAPEDSAETIGEKVLALEHRYFAGVIESLLSV